MELSLTKRGGTPRSTGERLWLLGGGVAAFVVLLVGYFFFISPQRSQTTDVKSQVDAAQGNNLSLQQRIDSLRTENKNLSRYQADYAAAQSALPSTSGMSDFLRSLQTLGNSTGATVSSLIVGAPKDVTANAASATPAAGATPAAAASSADPSATTSAAPAAPTTTGPKIYALPITAQVSGSPTALNKFLQQLQDVQPRAVLISQLTEGTGGTAAGNAGSTLLQLTMQAFVAPSSAAESAQLSQGSTP